MPEFAGLADRAVELTVRMGVAAALIAAFVVGGRATTPVVRRLLDRRRRPSYTRVFSALFRALVILVGSLFALRRWPGLSLPWPPFPSVRVADVLAIFGIVSVAAGFAFKDTFENLLAGVLLLLRDPFNPETRSRSPSGRATVEGVTVRETLLRAHDGRRYFIPNAKVMTDVIEDYACARGARGPDAGRGATGGADGRPRLPRRACAVPGPVGATVEEVRLSSRPGDAPVQDLHLWVEGMGLAAARPRAPGQRVSSSHPG